jgi:hypothetical protein
MANETAAGRDGWIWAMGRRFYHVYKQDFPMEFWYGLTPDANREDSPGLIDVRTLPEKYHHRPLTVEWLKIPKRSLAKAAREQLASHALAFANSIHDGYDLEAHATREEQRSREEWQAVPPRVAAETADCDSCSWPCTSEDCVPF